MSRRDRIATEVCSWIAERLEFAMPELETHLVRLFDLRSAVVIRTAIQDARDALREDHIEYVAVAGRPGIYVRATDAAAAIQSINYARGVMRKGRRATAIAACVREPDKLDPVLRRSLEGASERLALVAAAERRRGAE